MSKKTPVTREAAIAAAQVAQSQVKREPVDFFGLEAFIVEMSGGESDAFSAYQVAAGKQGTQMHNFRARFVARCLVNDAGDRLFNDSDVEELAAVPSSALDPLYRLATKVNKFGSEEREAEASK